jgi:hypothetical protein
MSEHAKFPFISGEYCWGVTMGIVIALYARDGVLDATLHGAFVGGAVYATALLLRSLPSVWRWLRRVMRYRVRVVKLDGESA